MKNTAYFWRKGLWAICSLFFIALLVFCALYLYLESQLPDVETLKTVQLQVPLRIYTKDGKLIQEYGEKRRIPLSYEEIPQTLVRALLATEDQRFFEHPGVDLLGLGRAAISVIQTGSKSQGGSTITMQVARNFFLSRKKTLLRKFNEILLAIKIDRELSKEKILELYLNKIYLGNRAYGVGAAAMVYYGKPLNQLTLAQLAMIAGLPQAPSTQNPIVNPIAAKKRRDHVLERLREEKYISEEQYQNAVQQPITAKYHKADIQVKAPYVAEMIRQSLYEHFGEKAYTNGYKVYTTVTSTNQNAAQNAVANQLIAYDHRHGYRGPVARTGKLLSESSEAVHDLLKPYPVISPLEPAVILSVGDKEAVAAMRHGQPLTIKWQGMSWARPALRKGWVGRAPTNASQILAVGDVVYVQNNDDIWVLSQIPQAEAALVAMNPQTGAIEALVGGFNFSRSKFNRATQSSRQPGSSFKPFVYSAALSKGYTLATVINDSPIVVDDPSQPTVWRPHNVNRTFGGPTRLKEALIKSRNLVSIRILADLGYDYAIDYITRFGFQKATMPRALSLALGSLSISPIDMTTAYAVFANGGYKVDPYLIDHITDENDEILLKQKPPVLCDDCEQQAGRVAPRIISREVAFLMNTALREVVQRGTGRGALALNRDDIAGKTGTTNDQVDAWFAGFNMGIVASVWVGYDNPRSLHEYGANVALPMWVEFMKTALQDVPEKTLEQPETVVEVEIDPKTGLLAKSNQSDAVKEYFREENVPKLDDAPPQWDLQQQQPVLQQEHHESLF